MKRIYLILIAGAMAVSASAQSKGDYSSDADLGRWVIDVNGLGGGFMQTYTAPSTNANYLNGLNENLGNLGFNKGMAFGGDVQLGFFFGSGRHWGLGTGLLYLRETGNATIDNFHVEYQSTDAGGNVFRQVVSGTNIQEQLKIDNFNIPLVLKFKDRFSKHWGFTADAGALFNLQMKNSYNTNAAFDYEAIYKFQDNGNGTGTAVYDNAAIPNANDFLITKAHYLANNKDGNVQAYFNQKASEGYNVGLGVRPNASKGSVSYATGSVGLLVQPSVNYFFSDHVALNIGGYYIYQPFANNKNNDYRLTNAPGDYSSVLNSATKVNTQSYGVNIGLRFFLGKRQAPPTISSVEVINPPACGLCEGGIVLHGLAPNREVTVNYSKNGAPQTAYTGTVDAGSTLKLSGLCAGKYSGIEAGRGRRKAKTADVTITDPVMTPVVTSTNPTAPGACDGTLTIGGLFAGRAVTINYSLDGNPQPAYAGKVNPDRSVTLTGLCGGTYSAIVASINGCSANGSVVTLTAPVPPPPPPPPPAPVAEKIDISTPILFNFNKTTIHPSSYPVLDEATKELEEDKSTYIRVDGHTDATGSKAYNQKLSVRRAAAVKTFLRKKGVNPKRVKIYGHGKSMPAASNETKEGRAENRRAVMKLEHKN